MTSWPLPTLLLVLLLAGCTMSPIKIENKDGVVSSVGPVVEGGDGLWTLHLSVYDYDGDPVDVTAEYRANGEWVALERCEGEATPCLVGGLRGLHSREDRGDQQHQTVIRPGALSLDSVELRLYALEDQSDAVTWPR